MVPAGNVGKHPIRPAPEAASVDSMALPEPRLPRYLAEWYGAGVTLTGEPLARTTAKLDESAAAMSADGSPVQLLMTLAVPDDEMLFGLFAAASAPIVSQTCHRAGIPADRLSFVVAARIAG
jgi:hypothetical protein